MRKILLTVILVSISFGAFATGKPNNNPSIDAEQKQQQQQLQDQQQQAKTGDINNEFNNPLQIPAGSVAFGGASSNTTAQHRYLEQDSESYLWGIYANTEVRMRWSLTDFIREIETSNYDQKSKTRMEKAACEEHQIMRQFRAKENNPCPAFSDDAANPLNQ